MRPACPLVHFMAHRLGDGRAGGQDEEGRNQSRFASLTGTCKTNGVEPLVCLRGGSPDRPTTPRQHTDALIPWTQSQRAIA